MSYHSKTYKQVVKVTWQKGRITAVHGWFSGIRQVAPVCTPRNTCFLGPTRVHNPNGIWIDSAIFTQLTAERPCTLQWAALSLSKLPLPTGDLAPIEYKISWAQRPTEPITQTAPRLVEPFLHSSMQSVPILYNGPPLPLTTCRALPPQNGLSGPYLIHDSLGPPESSTQMA